MYKFYIFLASIIIGMEINAITLQMSAQELKLESVAMETMTQTVPIQRKGLNGQV